MKRTIGERIKERRETLAMTQEELALKVGYSDKSTITKIEKGERELPQSKLLKFAEILETTPNYLAGYETVVSATQSTPIAPTFDQQEADIIDAFRSMNVEGQEALMTLIRAFEANPIYKKYPEAVSVGTIPEVKKVKKVG